jgi:Zn-dependent peptidase ImmA (M78 family)/transcriptional regulator with XRE-family HTH domain
MNVTQQDLGNRLRAAREGCHMTQDQVAQRLGTGRSTIVQIEAGNRSVASFELEKLAYIYGRDMREFLAEGFKEQDALVALFRAREDVLGQPEVPEGVRKCIALGRQLTTLERLLGIDRGPSAVATYPMAPMKSRWDAVQQGEKIAEEERRRLGLGSIIPAPDLVELLETQGVRTGVVDGLPDAVSGITLNDAGTGLFVVVNAAHNAMRQRFSLAHEYAHVVADRERFGLVSVASEREDLVEVRANSFAARFLMPEEGVKQFVAGLGKGKPSRAYIDVIDAEGAPLSVEGRTQPGSQTVQVYDVIQLAHHFQVSCQTSIYRLRQLRILSEQESASLLARLSKDTAVAELRSYLGLPEEPTRSKNTFRHRILGLALEALRREEITEAKLREIAKMVDLGRGDVDKLLKDAGLHDDDEANA